MAIVQCPECGGKVSTEAKMCVHCGCELSFCKECGAVFAGQINVCTECGSTIGKARYTSEQGEGFSGDSTRGLPGVRKIYRKWEAESGIKIYNTCRVLSFWLAIISAVIGLILFITANEWGFDYPTMRSIMITMFVLATAFVLIRILLDNPGVATLFASSKLSKWLGSRNIKLDNLVVDVMNSEGKNVFSSDIYSRNMAANIFAAKAMESDYVVKNTFMNTCIISGVIAAASSIFAGLFLMLNLSEFSKIVCLSNLETFLFSAFKFSMIEHWWMIIVSVIAFIGCHFYNNYASFIRKRAIDDWFNKNFLEYREEYAKYVSRNFKF